MSDWSFTFEWKNTDRWTSIPIKNWPLCWVLRGHAGDDRDESVGCRPMALVRPALHGAYVRRSPRAPCITAHFVRTGKKINYESKGPLVPRPQAQSLSQKA